jgi:hypothetical protein
MNRLVLIGNGFDLAHGLKTSYADFINWYWAQWGYLLRGKAKRFEEDELCSFSLNEIGLGGWYLVWGHYYHKTNPFNWDLNEVAKLAREDRKLCEFKYKSPFFEQINKSFENKRWVDIENEYYDLLVKAKTFGDQYQSLNKQLDSVRNKLITYLCEVSKVQPPMIEEIKEKIYRPIERRELQTSHPYVRNEELVIRNTQMLNFNYTNTPEMYRNYDTVINYIHGQLDSPTSVIFGYGDEMDENHKRLKEQKDGECLRHMKTLRYLDTDNYRRVLEFIHSGLFQVCIMGHSCGNSDRTLLNTIFEHPNCISVKPYYYQKPDGSDNYNELVQNIYRNFSDMKLMRDRVVCKKHCEPLIHNVQKDNCN